MLENSNLIEGEIAKEVDKLLVEYQGISAQLKDLETTKKAVLSRLFELTEIGINETSKHAFNIVKMSGRPSISLSELREKDKHLYDILEDSNFITTNADYLVVRGIKEKGSRV